MPVIGEGAFGCVHSPSLRCSEPGYNYANKVSKLMEQKYAVAELKEYDLINSIDPEHKFSLDNPRMCTPAADSAATIKECPILQHRFLSYNKKSGESQMKDDLALLIMPNGGRDLFHWYYELQGSNMELAEKKKWSDTFWRKTPILFKGLKVLQDRKVAHRDIKIENIVFDPTTSRLRMIDFGLMKTFDEMMSDHARKTGKRFHIPVELILNNPTTFEEDKEYYTKAAYVKDFLEVHLTSNDTGPGITRQEAFTNIEIEMNHFKIVIISNHINKIFCITLA